MLTCAVKGGGGGLGDAYPLIWLVIRTGAWEISKETNLDARLGSDGRVSW